MRERAILAALEQEQLAIDGHPIDRGRISNLFADRALVYGIALGILLAGGQGGTR